MSPDDPRHGTYAGVCQHKRDHEPPCNPCLEARRSYLRRRHKLRQMNRPGYMPLTALDIAKVRLARRYGWSLRDVASTLGCGQTTVWRITTASPGDAALTATVARIRAWTAPTEKSQPTGIGTLRRIQALMWCGYSGQAIADLAGVKAEGLNEGIKSGRTLWLIDTRRLIAAAYEHLVRQPPPGTKASRTRARNTALARGYAPPAAWDDIDDANEKPQGVRGAVA